MRLRRGDGAILSQLRPHRDAFSAPRPDAQDIDRRGARARGAAARPRHLSAGDARGASYRRLVRRGRGRAVPALRRLRCDAADRSEEHTSELQSLMRISYAVFCLKKQNKKYTTKHITRIA